MAAREGAYSIRDEPEPSGHDRLYHPDYVPQTPRRSNTTTVTAEYLKLRQGVFSLYEMASGVVSRAIHHTRADAVALANFSEGSLHPAPSESAGSATVTTDMLRNTLFVVGPAVLLCACAVGYWVSSEHVHNSSGNDTARRVSFDLSPERVSFDPARNSMKKKRLSVPNTEDDLAARLTAGGIDADTMRTTMVKDPDDVESSALSRLHQQLAKGHCSLRTLTSQSGKETVKRLVRLQLTCIFANFPKRGLCVLKCTKQGAESTAKYRCPSRRINTSDDVDEEVLISIEQAFGVHPVWAEQHTEHFFHRTVELDSGADEPVVRGISFPGLESGYVTEEVWLKLTDPNSKGLEGLSELSGAVPLGVAGAPYYELGPRWFNWFEATSEEMSVIGSSEAASSKPLDYVDAAA